MKIVAGLGSADDYIDFVKAGADECFCGYVPPEWNETYGTTRPLNRREVRNYQVQIGAWEELKILKSMIDCYGAPVQITLNALYYSGEQYRQIAELIDRCVSIGFNSFIVADPALLVYLRRQGIFCRIQLSGEFAEINSLMLGQLLSDADNVDGERIDIRRTEMQNGKQKETKIERVIFHRKNSIADMKSCVGKYRDQIPEYEAFFLNELCHFSGAFCNSLHCDEMGYLCHVPYELGRYDIYQLLNDYETIPNNQQSLKPEERGEKNNGEQEDWKEKQEEEGTDIDDDYLTGETGCGLCALYDLADAGITHLKLVGRGNFSEYMIRDIRQTRKALDILEETHQFGRDAYIKRMKAALFAGRCAQNCYYR